MDMELADYQRAADTLQEKLTAVCIVVSYYIILNCWYNYIVHSMFEYYRARISCLCSGFCD